MPELTQSQAELCQRLSDYVKKEWIGPGKTTKGVQPRDFHRMVARNYGKVTGWMKELDKCIDFCDGKRYKLFTAFRFRNWIEGGIARQEKWNRNMQEENRLRAGNAYEKAAYARRRENDLKRKEYGTERREPVSEF